MKDKAKKGLPKNNVSFSGSNHLSAKLEHLNSAVVSNECLKKGVFIFRPGRRRLPQAARAAVVLDTFFVTFKKNQSVFRQRRETCE